MASDMASSTFPWLTLAIFVPIVAGLLVLALGRDDRLNRTRFIALIGSIVAFLITIPLYTGFDPNTAQMQFVEFARRSEEHTSELQSRGHLVCRLLLETKKSKIALIDMQLC